MGRFQTSCGPKVNWLIFHRRYKYEGSWTRSRQNSLWLESGRTSISTSSNLLFESYMPRITRGGELSPPASKVWYILATSMGDMDTLPNRTADTPPVPWECRSVRRCCPFRFSRPVDRAFVTIFLISSVRKDLDKFFRHHFTSTPTLGYIWQVH